MAKRTYKNKNGYLEETPAHSLLIHRQIAFNEIYLKNRNRYPLKFNKYVVHHIDGVKVNNEISNLQILTKEKHNYIHRKIRFEELLKNKRIFRNVFLEAYNDEDKKHIINFIRYAVKLLDKKDIDTFFKMCIKALKPRRIKKGVTRDIFIGKDGQAYEKIKTK